MIPTNAANLWIFVSFISFVTCITSEAAFSSSQTYNGEASKFFEGFSTDEKYIVLVIDRLGLANRLRILADWYHIAVLTNRILLVSWKPTLDCNAKFTDLFDAGPEYLRVLPISMTLLEVESFVQEAHLSFYNLVCLYVSDNCPIEILHYVTSSFRTNTMT